MFSRILLLVFILGACRSSDMACPEVKIVKLNKKPTNYRIRMYDRSLSASNATETKEKPEGKPEGKPRQTRPVKSVASIEEWDCPKPGTKAAMPKTVKENIRKNRKKFETYYKNRISPDSLQIHSAN